MFGILGARDRNDGTEEYASFDELFAALKSRMQKDGYKVVKSRTHRNKVGGTYEKGSEVVRCDLVCDRGGQPYKCTATQLKTSTKKTNCPWKAKAVNRKTLGKWILTIICSEHNHEARTPDPPTDEEDADAEGDADIVQDTPAVPEAQSTGPTPDPTTAALLAVVGVTPSTMRLTGDTFHNFKTEYRKMAKPERLATLAQMQLRIAAIYAVENEDMQRQERQARQEKKHQEVEQNRRKSQSVQQSQQQQPPQQQQQQQHPSQPQPQPTQPAQPAPQQQTMPQQQQHQLQHQQVQHQQHQQHPHRQQHQQPQIQNHNHGHNHNHSHVQQQMSQMSRDGMAGMPKHSFEQSGHDEHAQYRDRQAEMEERNQRTMQMRGQQMSNAFQQNGVQQTPIPVPQFGIQSNMQSAPPNAAVFRHYAAAPANSTVPQGAAGGSPATGPKRRGRPKKTAMDQSLDASLHMTR
ncbi:Peptidase family T4 [Colletotrichum higginsianum IMI 349063]|uniref:Peptidase family T4 n=3 Tax=Colletotrichum higginsianum (strain IMI 349063) TaxID=759273 RepID=A0A1B7XXG1_COLHI|nr:Peptidase family T4 [Colletotrichum higginsianum IMI 349063]OBR04434.1 Peptidase family T4 [Colletotrichum higginsianum IMI 349063]